MPHTVGGYTRELLLSTPGSAGLSFQSLPSPLLCSVCLTAHDDTNDCQSDVRLLPALLPFYDVLPCSPPEEKRLPALSVPLILWIIPPCTRLVRHQTSGQLYVLPAVPPPVPVRSPLSSFFPSRQGTDTASRSPPARSSSKDTSASYRSGLSRYVTLCKRRQKKTAASCDSLIFCF